MTPISIRILRADETGPVPLHNRNDTCIHASRLVALRSAVEVRRAPDGVDLYRVSYPQARSFGRRVLDVPEVVPSRYSQTGVHGVNEEAGAVVAHFAVACGRLSPVTAGVREFGIVFDWVEGVPFAQLREGDVGELGFDESVRVGYVGCGVGSEDCAFVLRVAVDGGELDEVAVGVGWVGVFFDEVVVEGWAVHVERWILGAWEGRVEVDCLEFVGCQGAQARKGVVAGGAAGADREIVVHELALRHGVNCGEGLGFCCSSVEEVVVSAAVGG